MKEITKDDIYELGAEISRLTGLFLASKINIEQFNDNMLEILNTFFDEFEIK
jgi:hypothetical protein